MNQENMGDNSDALRDRLHKEAMGERPAFSEDIHYRVMRGIRSSTLVGESSGGNKVGLWVTAAAATICITAGVLCSIMLVRGHRASSSPIVEVIARNPQPRVQDAPRIAMAPGLKSVSLTLNIGGIISARLSPLGIAVRFPVGEDGGSIQPKQAMVVSKQLSAPLGSPEWLLARLQEPASSAEAALAELLPRDMPSVTKLPH